MVYHLNIRSPQISILNHVLRKPQTLHVTSNDLVPTHLRLSSPSPIMHKLNLLTPPHQCIYAPPFNMSKLSQSTLPHLFFKGCNSHFLSDHHIPKSIQSSIATHPPYHSHLSHHQHLGLSLLDWLTFCSIKQLRSDYHAMDFSFQSYRKSKDNY